MITILFSNKYFTMSSLFKKYLMALTGIVLIGFVFVHMLGNLQILLGQESINAYAHALQISLCPFSGAHEFSSSPALFCMPSPPSC